MDYGFAHEGVIFTPNQTTGIDVASNDARNRAIEQAELARWAGRPDSAIAYFKFPAEDLPLFGKARVYRANFYPCLHTYINVAREGDSPYAHEAIVSTWLGTTIGTIVTARVYRHNFGGRMVSITVRGTNGARYYGRASWDGGTVIRLRRVK